MFFSEAVPRVLARPTALIVAVAVILAAGLMVGVSPSGADDRIESGTGSGPDASTEKAPAKPGKKKKKKRARPGFSVATLNLEKGMSVSALRHDTRKIIRETETSVIGFQERLSSRPKLRKALPKRWRLLMPTRATGTDDNPIAFDRKVWKLRKSWAKKLAGHTWRRDSGKTAHDQFGVVAILKHRKTGHVIRAVSFHLPSGIHNRSTGGPDWSNADRVEATWRMAKNVRKLKRAAPRKQQFVVMCDCNVTHSKDHGNKLVKGKIGKPLKLENNYTAAGYRPGWRIDYVMGERRSPFRISGWRSFRDLRTDHPGIVARFKRR